MIMCNSASSDSETVQSATVQPQVENIMQNRSQQLHDSERLPSQQQPLAGSTETSSIQHQPTSSATGKHLISSHLHTHTHTHTYIHMHIYEGRGVVWLICMRCTCTRLSYQIIAGSAEYEVLIHHTVNLQLAVKANLIPLGAQLVAATIITPTQYHEIRNAHKSVDERVADLVEYVQNKVHQDPQHYHAFIGALRSDLSQYSGILAKLEDSFNSHPLTMAIGKQSAIQLHAQGTCMYKILNTYRSCPQSPYIPSFHAEMWATL